MANLSLPTSCKVIGPIMLVMLVMDILLCLQLTLSQTFWMILRRLPSQMLSRMCSMLTLHKTIPINHHGIKPSVICFKTMVRCKGHWNEHPWECSPCLGACQEGGVDGCSSKHMGFQFKQYPNCLAKKFKALFCVCSDLQNMGTTLRCGLLWFNGLLCTLW